MNKIKIRQRILSGLLAIMMGSFVGACFVGCKGSESNSSQGTSSSTIPDDGMSDDNTSDDNTSDDNTSDDSTSDDNTSDDNTSDDNTSDDNTSDDNTSDDSTSDDNTSDDNTSDDNTSDELEENGDWTEDVELLPVLPNEEESGTDIATLVDFIVEVPVGREPVILQLSDPQIIDAAQARTVDRLSEYEKEYWATDKIEERCYGYLRETIETVQPDLILLTGDIIYGSFDDAGTVWLSFIDFMESFDIPWAPVYGNHDNESAKGVDWQNEQLEKAENCLFKKGDVSGNGNYSVGISQGGELLRVFYMLDTHGCLDSIGLKDDQVNWYTEEALQVIEESPETKISFAFHIQPYVFFDAYRKYGFKNTGTDANPIFVDQLTYADDGDFGFLGQDLKTPWDTGYTIWRGMKDLGVDSIFVGHEHGNSVSVVYEGVRFQFGQKSSTYDRANYVKADGTIEPSYVEVGIPWVGGTVMVLSEDGTIQDAYIYLAENAGGNIDWSQWSHYVDDGVSGLKYGKDFTASAGINIQSVAVMQDSYGYNVQGYEIDALSQGELYLNTQLLKTATTFSFAVKVMENTPKLDGYGEFAIRINGAKEPFIDGIQDGYINYNSASKINAVKIVLGEWQIFTVDVSEIDDQCSEFAFVIPAGATIYLKDLALLDSVPYATWTSGDTSVDANAPIPGGWNSGMYSVTLAAGDTLKITTPIDWTGKTLANDWSGYGISLNNMTKASYVNKEFTVTFTNVEDSTQYITFKNVMGENGKVLVYVSYSGGQSAVWTTCYYGNDVGSSCFDILFSVKCGADGVKFKWNNLQTLLSIDNFFTKAYMTVTSETGISVTFEAIGGARDWQTKNYVVKYYVEDEVVYSENIKAGASVLYAENPSNNDKIFVGWYTTKEDAKIADPANIYDMTSPVIGNLNLYAGFADCRFVMLSSLQFNYLVNCEMEIPTAQFITSNDTVAANIIVKDASGNNIPLNDGKITPTSLGLYTIVYTAVAQGKTYTEERTFNVVDQLPFASWTMEGSSMDTNAGVSADSWTSGMFQVTLAAGDTMTLTEQIDWTGKSLSDNWIGYQLSLHNGTKEEYMGRDITIKLTNPDDETEFITLRNVMDEDGQVWLYVSYSKGDSKTFAFCKYGSDAGSSYGSRMYTVYVSENGVKGAFRTSEGILSVENLFTKAIVTISSTSGISATFTYIGHARDWQD